MPAHRETRGAARFFAPQRPNAASVHSLHDSACRENLWRLAADPPGNRVKLILHERRDFHRSETSRVGPYRPPESSRSSACGGYRFFNLSTSDRNVGVSPSMATRSVSISSTSPWLAARRIQSS